MIETEREKEKLNHKPAATLSKHFQYFNEPHRQQQQQKAVNCLHFTYVMFPLVETLKYNRELPTKLMIFLYEEVPMHNITLHNRAFSHGLIFNILLLLFYPHVCI